MRRSSSFILLSLLVACAPSLRKPESPQLVVTGTVTAAGFERRGSPIEGATLVLRLEIIEMVVPCEEYAAIIARAE